MAIVNFEHHPMAQDRSIDPCDQTLESRVVTWNEPQTGLPPNRSNDLNELTASSSSHTRGRAVEKINHPLIRQESLKLSQSAPNLELFNRRQMRCLTPEEYTAHFINENLKLFEFYHNLASNGRSDQSAEFTDSNEDAMLFERENEIQQLNENAIDFLKNFSTHRYLHQYRQETNGKFLSSS